MIRFENVTFAYPNGATVLDNLSLHIERGEKVSIVGNNGSGKTTLALLINGVLKASSGKINIDGLDPADENDNRLLKHKVGLVFQNPDNQLVSTTVEREVAFSLENMNVPHDEMHRRVERMLDFFGLADFRKKLTSDLSGGEKQRLALAAVMVAEPEILIFDEPGSFLDETGKRLLNDAVDLLLAEKPDLTVLRITQYADEAERSPRMIVFEDGRITADNDPDKIFTDSQSLETLGVTVPLKYRISRPTNQTTTSIRPTAGANEAKASIRLNSVAFHYNGKSGHRLFENLDLKIDSDKVYGLVGPSGSGKTTLIQLMAGLLKPDSGKIEYDGFTPASGRLAVSFQQPERQFFLDTVDKEIRFGAENLGLEHIDQISEKCYTLIGLEKQVYAYRNPFTLSGGEKRKLAFGTILSLTPNFIFFDEPTCGLDRRGVVKFNRLVRRLSDDGVGIVVISHFGDIILELADEIIDLEKGRINSIQKKDDFFRRCDYSGYLSTPDLIAYQMEKFGEIKYFNEDEFRHNL